MMMCGWLLDASSIGGAMVGRVALWLLICSNLLIVITF
jgi:hypothetical protein